MLDLPPVTSLAVFRSLSALHFRYISYPEDLFTEPRRFKLNILFGFRVYLLRDDVIHAELGRSIRSIRQIKTTVDYLISCWTNLSNTADVYIFMINVLGWVALLRLRMRISASSRRPEEVLILLNPCSWSDYTQSPRALENWLLLKAPPPPPFTKDYLRMLFLLSVDKYKNLIIGFFSSPTLKLVWKSFYDHPVSILWSIRSYSFCKI